MSLVSVNDALSKRNAKRTALPVSLNKRSASQGGIAVCSVGKALEMSGAGSKSPSRDCGPQGQLLNLPGCFLNRLDMVASKMGVQNF